MVKNYEALFKIEHSGISKGIFVYTVYRKNFLDKFEEVARVGLFPGERAETNFLVRLSYSEKIYIERYFKDLTNLKVEPSPNSKFNYTVYRRNSSNGFEIVAMSNGYEVTAVKHLKPHESAYLDAYFRNLLN